MYVTQAGSLLYGRMLVIWSLRADPEAHVAIATVIYGISIGPEGQTAW